MNCIIDDDDDKNDTSNEDLGTADIPALDINPTGTIDTNENNFVFKRFFDLFEDNRKRDLCLCPSFYYAVIYIVELSLLIKT